LLLYLHIKQAEVDLNLNGKRALVCGSTQGIGKACAKELAALGASITLLARNEPRLKETLLELPVESGQQHNYLVADFEEPAVLEKVIGEYVSSRVIHILVNNTGGPPPGPAIDANIEDFLKAFSNHLLCNQILAQAVTPGMSTERYGRIINIISTSVKMPIRGLGVSNTVRGAVASWSKTLSFELAKFGITVNNVLPGATMTARLESIIQRNAEKAGHSVSEETDQMVSEIPVGRIAVPSEIAAAVAFLATPAAGYINGINVPVDGGRTGTL
jgi:3-oxoacyl-[acyl-carrier protein] reductase